MRKIESSIDRRRITNRPIAIILAAAALGLFASTAVRADDSVGTVTQVNGSAQIERGGATIAAQQGTPLKLHDKVTTTDGSVTMGFGDGSSMALSSSTSVEIEDSTAVNGQNVPSRVTSNQRRHSYDCPRQDRAAA